MPAALQGVPGDVAATEVAPDDRHRPRDRGVADRDQAAGDHLERTEVGRALRRAGAQGLAPRDLDLLRPLRAVRLLPPIEVDATSVELVEPGVGS